MTAPRIFSNRFASVIAIVAAAGACADGWGPTSRSAIVTTAAHVVSRDLTLPLTQFDRYVREGAMLSDEEVLALHPDVEINPVRAIEEEIYLLQAIRSDRIDPYFAFRLGVLGQIVADTVAPMRTAAPELEQQYFKDAERYIQSVEMNSTARRVIDATYFPEQMRRAAAQDDTIEVDYRSGEGFEGLALASLSSDASRAVNSVADTFYTVVVAPVSRLNVSQNDMRQYALGALEYYLRSGKLREADSAVDAVLGSGAVTPELEKQIADVYFEAEHYDKAMEHYRSVLNADPTQREVAARVSRFYESLGDEAMERNFLEDARDAYEQAASVDQMNEDAHRKLYTAERSIESRDARLESARAALELAREYGTEAEKAKLAGNYVESLSHLREARAQYETVTDEFPDLHRDADRGIRLLDLEMKEMRTNLVGSVQRLSGSGYPYTARRLGRAMPGVERQAFHSLHQIELNTAMDAIVEEVGRDIEALR